MALSTYRVGTPRARGEGLRIAPVRFLPRGVKKADYARKDYFDVWLPVLAPSAALFKWIMARQDDPAAWTTFRRRYAREMERPEARQTIALLAALSDRADFAIGCYCEDEARCHRSVLRQLIARAARPESA
jgi:uncharacterized protein YeaO (DUF488 family)